MATLRYGQPRILSVISTENQVQVLTYVDAPAEYRPHLQAGGSVEATLLS